MTEDDRNDGGSADDFAALLAASEQTAPQVSAGELVRGRVIAVGATTAFVEIGAKGEAMIDVGEFRDSDGAVQLAVGDEIEATVVDDGRTSGTVQLKRTVGRGGHVPGELEQALAHGIAVEGLVTGENKGGFDVQIGTVHAFCPGSQIDRRRGEAATPYVGQRFRFHVMKIEAGGRNIVVSRRTLLEEEARAEAERTWERIQVGAVLEGRVTAVRDFGAFVDLGGVEGLIHVSELGHARVAHPSEVIESGQSVEVKVVNVEPATAGGRARIGLSLRALAPDPWTAVRERFPVGSTVPGTVRKVESFGAFVELAPGLDGLVHVSKLALDRRVAHPRQVVSVGAGVEVTILAVDEAQRRISLSMVEQARRARDAQDASSKRDEQDALGQINEKRSLGTFADLLAASKRKP